MAGYPPPPPGQGFAPPAPQPGAGFAPPPPGQGFAPPPPQPGGGFAPPPPAPGQGFAPPPPPAGGGFAPPPPPGGGFVPPPPPGGFAPPPPPNGAMQQLNQGMAGMSMQQPPPRGAPSFQPPGQGQPPPPPAAGTGFGASSAPGQGFAPPPPGGGQGFAPPPPGAPPQMGAPKPPPPGNMQAPGAGFYQQQPAPGPPQMQQAPAPPCAGAAPGGAAPQANAPIYNENIDFSIKIPERLVQFTASKVAQTAQLAAGTKIPFGAVMRPLAPEGVDEEIDTVQPGTAGIIRCKRCRTYINAFVSWSEHGRRWRCNICAQINDCPAAYFCHLDEAGLRRDRLERPELSKAVVEFIAPAEYMVRPPQEPSYFFVIDVSATAVRSGMVHSTAKAIKESLDDLPGQGRTKVGFITFDNAVHYYNLSSELSAPQMMVVADLKELFVPLPDHLLVNLQESRAVVDQFLDSLPEMFVKNPVVSQSCLGPALKAGFTVMKNIGGKLCVFQSIMPNLGDGALKQRENRSLMGTPNEVKLIRPEVTWYKDTAVEFSRQQISVDMFLFPYQYMDLAAMAELPRYTAGSVHSYVSFNHKKDGSRFEQQLIKVLTQKTAFEAVMRVRCTKGMRISNFYGNFYIRGTDLLALPNCNTDSVFGFDISHDEQNVSSNYVTLQAALLYTSSEGQRRIRVMTQVLPVTNRSSELMASVNVDTVCNLLSKQAVEVAVKSSLDNARMRLQQTCVDMIRVCKEGDKRTVSGYPVPPPGGHAGGHDSEEKTIPDNLQLLPLYTLALMKNVAFRGGTDIHPDERIQAHRQMISMWVAQSKDFIYPRLFAIHSMEENVGYSVEDLPNGGGEDAMTAGRNRILLPTVLNLTVDQLRSNGIYLLDNGIDMYLWVGRAADISLVGSLFGVQSLDDCDLNQLEVLTSGDPLASRLGAIIDALRDEGDQFVISPKIHVVREGDQHMESRFFWFLVEDRASFQGGTFSYADFMQFVNNPNQGGTPGGAPRAPGGAMPPGGRGPPGPPGQPGMPPPGQPGMPTAPGQHGMGMAPPGRGMPPPPCHPGGMGGPTPLPGGMGGPPPPPPGGMGGLPPPQGMGAPPPPPGGMGGPSPHGVMAGPPQPGGMRPPSGEGYGGRPPQAPGPPQHQAYGGPPSGPPGGAPTYGVPPGPPQAPPGHASYGAPPPPGPPRGPPPPGPPRGALPPPGPPRGAPTPPGPPGAPPPRAMPPPPPPGSYR